MGAIMYLAPVSAAQIIHPDRDLKTMSISHSSLWGNKHSDPQYFPQAFAKNSLIKNMFEEEKSLRVGQDFFFCKIVLFLVYWVKAKTSR